MIDTSRPNCPACQARATDLRTDRDPYTREALYEDVAALIERGEHQAEALARTVKEVAL